jgi:hypothetical protein
MLDSTGPFVTIVAIILVGAIYVTSIYNALVRLRNHISIRADPEPGCRGQGIRGPRARNIGTRHRAT